MSTHTFSVGIEAEAYANHVIGADWRENGGFRDGGLIQQGVDFGADELYFSNSTDPLIAWPILYDAVYSTSQSSVRHLSP